jgi:hypothetical protein
MPLDEISFAVFLAWYISPVSGGLDSRPREEERINHYAGGVKNPAAAQRELRQVAVPDRGAIALIAAGWRPIAEFTSRACKIIFGVYSIPPDTPIASSNCLAGSRAV